MLLFSLSVLGIVPLANTFAISFFDNIKNDFLSARQENTADRIPIRLCGTGPPTQALIDTHVDLSMENRKLRPRKTTPAKLVVDTYFHIVSTTDQQKLVSTDMVSNQFGILSSSYAAANIAFRLVNTTYSVNNSWATDSDDATMKATLRQGTYASLNVYFQTNLSSFDYGTESQLLGYCTLPTNVTYKPCSTCNPVEFPANDYNGDGCNVLAGSMPGGPVTGYNLGKTAVHEIGHWFGLLHTFQDNTCTPGDPGDYIDDTPQESVSTDGCPTAKDSCTALTGADPIHNFMDYSTDKCYVNFTSDQYTRMQNMYTNMRLGN